MKKTTSLISSAFSLLLFFLFFYSTAFAIPTNDEVILEITDQNKQLTVGIAKDHVFILIKDDLRRFYNSEIKNYERKEWHTFTDSGGNYIPGSHSYLDSEYFRIPFYEIDNIVFENGSIELIFNSNSSSSFKNILSDLGTDFFNNFNNEDLKAFHQAYLNLK